MGNLVRQASMIALRETLKSGQRSKDNIVLQTRHFERAFSSVRPSVGERERAKYEAMGQKYGVSLEVEMTEPELSSKTGSSLPDVEMTEPVQDDVMESSNGLLKSDNRTNTSQDVVMNDEAQETEMSNIQEDEEEEIRINEVTSVSDTSIEDESKTGSSLPELRFLPGMEVRVSDKCKDVAISGHCGVVTDTMDNGNKLTILIGKNSSHEVSVENLEPSLPEEGDRVKTLVWGVTSNIGGPFDGNGGSFESAGTVQSIDEEDNASVKFVNGDTHPFPLEKLCKITAEEDDM